MEAALQQTLEQCLARSGVPHYVVQDMWSLCVLFRLRAGRAEDLHSHLSGRLLWSRDLPWEAIC
eukprot:2160002-Karenia_brevis.AAC.1